MYFRSARSAPRYRFNDAASRRMPQELARAKAEFEAGSAWQASLGARKGSRRRPASGRRCGHCQVESCNPLRRLGESCGYRTIARTGFNFVQVLSTRTTGVSAGGDPGRQRRVARAIRKPRQVDRRIKWRRAPRPRVPVRSASVLTRWRGPGLFNGLRQFPSAVPSSWSAEFGTRR